MAVENSRPPVFSEAQIGYCLSCIIERKQSGRGNPKLAITLAPMPIGPGMAIAVPTCWDHLNIAQAPTLLRAQSNLS